jgi:hypothetical protein
MKSDAKPAGKNKTTPNAKRKANIQTANSQTSVPLAPAAPELPPTHPHYQIACEPKKDWWDRNKKWAEIAGLILLAIYTAYTIKMYCANEEAANAAASAANTAAKTLEMDRPYVSIEVVPTSDLQFTAAGQGYLRLGSTAINYGRNPALNAKIWVQFLSQAKGSPKSETDPTAFCENLPNHGKPSVEGVWGGTYFPQVPYRASWIAEDQGPAGTQIPKLFLPTIIACVAYQSQFSKDWLYTGKMYTVMVARNDKLGGALAPTRGHTVPQNKLVLAPYIVPEISK